MPTESTTTAATKGMSAPVAAQLDLSRLPTEQLVKIPARLATELEELQRKIRIDASKDAIEQLRLKQKELQVLGSVLESQLGLAKSQVEKLEQTARTAENLNERDTAERRLGREKERLDELSQMIKLFKIADELLKKEVPSSEEALSPATDLDEYRDPNRTATSERTDETDDMADQDTAEDVVEGP